MNLDILRDSKNLLAFSGGVDSTYLFFLLLKNGIDFDMAIVNYGVRKEAKNEVKYAKKLAKKYHKNIFVLESPKIKSDFENKARGVRYEFFESIIAKHYYDNLILAHQLNDRLEWFLMQLTKGCGLNSLLGFSEVKETNLQFLKTHTKNITYRIVRPLIETSRGEILAFLKKHKIKYFIDKSNKNMAFKRNYFRKHFSNKLVKNFKKGIVKSFCYLYNDFLVLYGENAMIEWGHIVLIKRKISEKNLANYLQILSNIDSVAKTFGYVVSKKQRDEIVKSDFSCILGDKIIIDSNENYIFVAINDFKKAQKHNKKFREKLRIAKIPPKIRPFVNEKCLKRFKILESQTLESQTLES